jgi:hypothetical protein
MAARGGPAAEIRVVERDVGPARRRARQAGAAERRAVAGDPRREGLEQRVVAGVMRRVEGVDLGRARPDRGAGVERFARGLAELGGGEQDPAAQPVDHVAPPVPRRAAERRQRHARAQRVRKQVDRRRSRRGEDDERLRKRSAGAGGFVIGGGEGVAAPAQPSRRAALARRPAEGEAQPRRVEPETRRPGRDASQRVEPPRRRGQAVEQAVGVAPFRVGVVAVAMDHRDRGAAFLRRRRQSRAQRLRVEPRRPPAIRPKNGHLRPLDDAISVSSFGAAYAAPARHRGDEAVNKPRQTSQIADDARS